ncbi:hypothetical protein OSTOST_09107, partial [Ostertagia ostertagi]
MVEKIASPYGNTRENLRRTLQRNQRRGLNPDSSRPRLTGKTRKNRVKAEPPSPEQEESALTTKELKLPVQTIPRKRLSCTEPISTLVFMDLASTHIFPGYSEAQLRITPQLLYEPARSQPSDFPRITEMSFLSVPRDVFVRGQKTIQSLIQEAPEQSFVLRLSANVRTCQVNPQLSEKQWQECQSTKASDSTVVRRARHDLELKRTFAQEWPSMRKFLEDCAKPVCLIAHNGMFFDFRTLYGELIRCGFIEKGMGIPKGVVFVDSTLAIREIENIYCKEVSEATKKLAAEKVLQEAAALKEASGGTREEVKVHSRASLDEHPLSVFSVQLWPAAKMRRIRPEFFRQDGRGRWEFNMTAAKNGLKDDLSVLYESVVKTPYLSHFTQDDAEALMQLGAKSGSVHITAMSSRGRSTKMTAQTSVRQSCTIMAAFERQTRKKDCPVCKQSVLLTLYRAHLDRCQLTSNDSDCEIISVLTGAESRALHAGPSIVIDDEEVDIKADTCIEASSTTSALRVEQRRSERIKVREETTDEVTILKVEQIDHSNEDPENRPPDKKRFHYSSEEHGIISKKRSKRPSRCSPTLDDRSLMETNTEKHLVPDQMERKLVSADEIVRKIEQILSNSSSNPSPHKADDEVDQSSQTMEYKRIPYIVKFTLLMMRRVLLAVKSDGTRYDESFLDLSRNARELFMRLHLRKSWWLTVDKLKERYAELSNDMESALVQLVDNGFVDSDRSLVSLEEALKVAPLPVLKSVAKIYQLDTTKGKIELSTTLTTFSAKQKGLFGQVGTVAVAMLRTIKKELGPCYRVNQKASELF